MKSINLIFGCHAHQPVGNFDFVFERAYGDCYLPFLDVLERYPDVRVTMHFTGPLYDWFEENAPHFLERLAAMVRTGQIEIMGGGYYEPLLCAIPERDARSQIERMSGYCERRFGVRPGGMWLTERVWEPHMARILASAGIAYTPLDDSHFLYSGLDREELFGYYLTEDEGMSVRIFPIQERLRYLVPFHPVEETINWLEEHATESGTRCAVLHDDYEKFGVWPGTNKSVYGEGWLERFFQALSENKSWLRSVTYGQYMAANTALGRTYITCASYDEMMTWALPTGTQRELVHAREDLKQSPDLYQACAKFMRGGFWRSFLAKYAESNNIQKRMLRASSRLDRLRRTAAGDPRLNDAEKLLQQGQCNCAYWHGVFGGLYLNHLRTALYEKIIASDVVMDGIEADGLRFPRFESVDFDGDGNPEGILENERLALFFSPSDGGTLFEIDYKPKPFNIGNVLTRREEVYHEQIQQGSAIIGQETGGDLSIHELVKAKEANLDRLLVYDPWRRVSLRDRFISVNATAESLWSGTEPELGPFARIPYAMTGEGGIIRLEAKGTMKSPGLAGAHLHKTISLAQREASFEVDYLIEFMAPAHSELLFGTELTFNFLTGDAPDRYYQSDSAPIEDNRLGSRGVLEEISHIAARDEWQHLEISFSFSRPARLFRFPVDTVSQSEDGQERVHQGCVVVPCWTLSEDTSRFSVGLRIDITQPDV
ncbi:MAG: DUF1926 domain-containing protein [Candidatus Hydrogenedentes bacterium]|mgnify:CR=1 FL=1|nr:DUF1926 domain-containing protein [Candidatus Hydrogenedentota bacterium]